MSFELTNELALVEYIVTQMHMWFSSCRELSDHSVVLMIFMSIQRFAGRLRDCNRVESKSI